MEKTKADVDSSQQVLLRMPASLKREFQRRAFANRRSLTAEINLALESVVEGSAVSPASVREAAASYVVAAEGPAEREFLEAFRRLDEEKQQALLTLLK